MRYRPKDPSLLQLNQQGKTPSNFKHQPNQPKFHPVKHPSSLKVCYRTTRVSLTVRSQLPKYRIWPLSSSSSTRVSFRSDSLRLHTPWSRIGTNHLLSRHTVRSLLRLSSLNKEALRLKSYPMLALPTLGTVTSRRSRSQTQPWNCPQESVTTLRPAASKNSLRGKRESTDNDRQKKGCRSQCLITHKYKQSIYDESSCSV